MTAPALVLYSGGVDSTTCLALAKEQGFSPIYLLSFFYGQTHDNGRLPPEMQEHFNIPKDGWLQCRLPRLGRNSSSLTNRKTLEVPKGKDPSAPGIPNTYVPGRNIIFLSHAVSVAEDLGIKDIFIGVNRLDWSGYPDCRGEFLNAFQRAVNEGTRTGIEGEGFLFHAPLLDLTKADIIKRGTESGVDYAWTFSCYDPQDPAAHGSDLDGVWACGTCDSCQLRLAGFAANRIEDPIQYLVRA